MKSEQTSVDTIAHNISNVNTTGYKEQTAQFKSLLYQTVQAETTTANGVNKPTTAQVGLGTRIGSINSNFTTGVMLESDNPYSAFINGDGFFQVRGNDGALYYSRDGNFAFATSLNADEVVLTNSQGNPVLDYQGNQIVLPSGIQANNVMYNHDGTVSYRNPDGTVTNTNQRIALYQFPNVTGLDKVGDNLYTPSEASGAAISEAEGNPNITPSSIKQGYLEGSNVSIADEMVNLIVAQRAYEMNSKTITTSDSMLQTATQLKQ